MNREFIRNTSNLSPSSTIPRIKSLIKPPPSRTSWELLLDDYLKDPNLKLKFSPSASPSYKQSFIPPQSAFSYPTEPAFIPNYAPQSSFSHSYPTNSPLPPRRYHMDLDELVYLISEVGRSDLYREIVQHIQVQPFPAGLSASHPMSQASNINACSSNESAESFFLDFSLNR